MHMSDTATTVKRHGNTVIGCLSRPPIQATKCEVSEGLTVNSFQLFGSVSPIGCTIQVMSKLSKAKHRDHFRSSQDPEMPSQARGVEAKEAPG